MTLIYIRGTGATPATFSAVLLYGQLRRAPKTPQGCSLPCKAWLVPVKECGLRRGAEKPGEGTAEKHAWCVRADGLYCLRINTVDTATDSD